MEDLRKEVKTHPTEVELADYLGKTLSESRRQGVEAHMAGCEECLERVVSAYESVKLFKKKKVNIMKKTNIYLILAVVFFILSFTIRQYFLQFLTATLILGIKWVVDSKSTKMLVMIYEAWKKEGADGASRIIKNIEAGRKNRL